MTDVDLAVARLVLARKDPRPGRRSAAAPATFATMQAADPGAPPLMKSILIVALALCLSACDSASEAVAAGRHMNQTLQKCVDHMKAQQGDTGIPECNGMAEQVAYLKAKGKVKEPSPELDAIDQKALQLRQEAMRIVQGSAPSK